MAIIMSQTHLNYLTSDVVLFRTYKKMQYSCGEDDKLLSQIKVPWNTSKANDFQSLNC